MASTDIKTTPQKLTSFKELIRLLNEVSHDIRVAASNRSTSLQDPDDSPIAIYATEDTILSAAETIFTEVRDQMSSFISTNGFESERIYAVATVAGWTTIDHWVFSTTTLHAVDREGNTLAIFDLDADDVIQVTNANTPANDTIVELSAATASLLSDTVDTPWTVDASDTTAIVTLLRKAV